MNEVLKDLHEDNLIFYVDDLLLFTKTIEENLKMCDEVLRRLARAGLLAKPSKTIFLAKELRFLGFFHSALGLRNDPEKIAPLYRMSPPYDKTSARSFMGLVNYFRKSVPALSVIASPIHKITSKKATFVWGEDQVRAYNEVLTRLTTSPILARFETNRECFIFTDASSKGGSAWLLQNDSKGDPHLIARSH